MKKLWKIYDVSLISIVIAFSFCVVVSFYNVILSIMGFALIFCFAAAKFYHYKSVKERLEYKVKTVSAELDSSKGSAFNSLGIACVAVEEDGELIWINEKFQIEFSIKKDDKFENIKEILKKDDIKRVLQGKGFTVKVDSKYYSVYSISFSVDSENIYLLYFFDETKLRLTEKEYYETKPSVIYTVIDNSDEIYQNFKESECTQIFSQLEQLIDSWASSYGALCRKFSNARMLIVAEERALQKMITDKFFILDKIRDFTFEGRSTDVTLSMGVGKDKDLNEANNSARQAIDMAQSRGGDQVAIKNGAQYRFYGGVSEGKEKRNRVRTRLISKTISEIISDSDNVIIMGHRFSDFDCFGASVGMYSIAKKFGKRAYICVDVKTSLAYALIERVAERIPEIEIISPDRVLSKVTENTLLVVVDTHRKDFTECPELVDSCEKVMVIDHHRKAVDYINDTVMFYHMPNASSASEMVAEIAQYIDARSIISPEAATAMLSGIMLDTRSFIIRSGVRTFEAAAFLRERGANTVECKKLFSNDMDIFRYRNTIIDLASKYGECAISTFNDEVRNMRLITSQAADEMINIDGVKASFVLYKNGNGVNISARSYGEINVQLVMEVLGGGGHQTMAACQLSDISIDEAEKVLKKAIDNYYSNI